MEITDTKVCRSSTRLAEDLILATELATVTAER